MPSKQFLMDNYKSAQELLEWANSTHQVRVKLHYVKKQVDGSIKICAVMAADHNDKFVGTGATKQEALASALSAKYPA